METARQAAPGLAVDRRPAETRCVNGALRLGQVADFARVGALFERAGFREDVICRGLEIPSMAQLGKVPPEGLDLAAALGSATLALLAQVYVFTKVVSREDVRSEERRVGKECSSRGQRRT